MGSHRRRRRAFTLVELLVVIGIIGLLISIIMPALNKAREQARRTRCLSNMRQLSIAWMLYATDSKGRICGSNTPPFVPPNGNPREFNWVTMDPATGGDSIRAIQGGMLFRYINSIEAYHCPNTNYLRTYSMNGWLLGEGPVSRVTNKLAMHTSDIKKPHATFVFIEEWDPRGYMINSFMVPPWNQSTWVDIPAPLHDRVGLLAFADGHAKVWPWTDPRTWNRKNQFGTSTPNNPDLMDLQAWRGPGGIETPPGRAW